MRRFVPSIVASLAALLLVPAACGTSDTGAADSADGSVTMPVDDGSATMPSDDAGLPSPDAAQLDAPASDSSMNPIDASRDGGTDAFVPTVVLRAGALGGGGNVDGTGPAARFLSPRSIAVDGAGNLFVADTYNQIIRKVTPAGVVTTFAGTTNIVGNVDGTGTAARFNYPEGIAIDGAGNVFVGDAYNCAIRKITPAGVVTTFAGGLSQGSADGTASAAQFHSPAGISFDAAGNLYVADSGNSTIRKVTPLAVVTTLAGHAGVPGSADGTGVAAAFNNPLGVAVDTAGNVFVADTSATTIRKIAAGGVVTTFAGLANSGGSANGTGSAARFEYPYGLAVDGAGNVFVADSGNEMIRKITPAGVVTVFAGSPGYGHVDATGGAAKFFLPTAIAIDAAGDLFVTDSQNDSVRKITTAAVVTTVAGTADGRGWADGAGTVARFDAPWGAAVDATGNVFVADYDDHTIRKVAPDGTVTTFAGSNYVNSFADGTGSSARFYSPEGVALDAAGNLFVADSYNQVIRKVTSAGVVTTIGGSPGVTGTADGTGAAARFNYPGAVAVDGAGNVFVVDTFSGTIRKITSAGLVTTIAGIAGAQGNADGPAATATFDAPQAIAVDGAGNIFVTEGVHTIRKITPAGVVSTFAGSFNARGSADGTGAAARFNLPTAITVDSAGNLFVADSSNYTVRKITPAAVVTTIAGIANVAFVKPGPLPTSLNSINGIAVTTSGNLVVTSENSILDVLLH